MPGIDPKHAERIRERGGPEDPTVRDARHAVKRSDDGEAFLPDPIAENEHAPLPADDAEWFAEEFIASATGGETVAEDARDEITEDEDGGPFLELDAEAEASEDVGDEGELEVPTAREPKELEPPPENLRSRHIPKRTPF